MYKKGEYLTATIDYIYKRDGRLLFKKGEKYKVTYVSDTMVWVAYDYDYNGRPRTAHYSFSNLAKIFGRSVEDNYDYAMGLV